MREDNEEIRSIFARADLRPPGLSTVDVGKAIETGKRRKRVRRLGLGGTAVSLSVIAAIAIPFVLQADRGRTVHATASASPSTAPSVLPSPTVKAGFQTRHYDRPAPSALPTSCQGTKLPVPGGGIKSYVSNVDPSGNYVVGRVYNGDPEPVLWHNGTAMRVPMGGGDDGLDGVNSKGDAVGYSYLDQGPRSKAYIGGVLHELKGGTTEARAINGQGKIAGSLGATPFTKAVMWPSFDADPVELKVPQGIRASMAYDLDEDGTVVGNLGVAGQRIAYVWYPDGNGQPLPTPTLNGVPSTDFDARRVRNGWVTGYAEIGQGPRVGVRWDLTTGKAEVFEKVQWSNDVGPQGWLVGMDQANDAILTDGSTILKLPDVFPKPADFGMNWAEAISDDGLTMAGHNDDKNHDDEQRGVVWKCH